jgi:hypothetical protein
MNKKSIIGFLIIFLFMAALVTNNAFASMPPPSYVSFDEMHMTSLNGTYDTRTTYDLNETPWLYLKLPAETESSHNVTGSWWNDPDNEVYFLSNDSGQPTSDQEIWLSLNWNSVKKVGQWDVNAFYSAANGTYGSGDTHFTVTPEPVSYLLFITGGAILTLKRCLKRRKRQ